MVRRHPPILGGLLIVLAIVLLLALMKYWLCIALLSVCSWIIKTFAPKEGR